MRPIFPKLEIRTMKESTGFDFLKGAKERFHVCVTTNVRKLHEGKWYLCEVIEKSMIAFPDDETQLALINQCVEKCNASAYKFLLFGFVFPGRKGFPGKDIFEIDSDQRSEAERLNVVLNENL